MSEDSFIIVSDNKCYNHECTNIHDKKHYSITHKYTINGFFKNYYDRYFCSEQCLKIFEKNEKCNLCNTEYHNLKKGCDGFCYCNEIYDTNKSKSCYDSKFE
jgi:hypothetical protein